MKNKIQIKTSEELEKMKAGGKKLAFVKKELMKNVKAGVKASEIEDMANNLIEKEGGRSSFKMVPGYFWATCVNINDGLVHGIPHKTLVFKKGDIVSVDVGMYYKGYHTDCSFSVGIDLGKDDKKFLETGKQALNKALKQVKLGNRIYDISKAMEETLIKDGCSPVKALVGHGIGKDLHEQPQIPCFTHGRREDTPEIAEGMALAVEVMYTKGSSDIKIDSDGWTISTADGKISALFEETVAIDAHGHYILTD